MSDAALGEALLAARLLALAPRQLGGIVLRGGGPARDLVLDELRSQVPGRWHRLPGNVDDERLFGGIDVAASLAAGRAVMRPGLLAEAAGGVLVVPMAERLRDHVAGALAQALDGAAPFALVLLDDGCDPDQRPPPGLLDRIAFAVDLSPVASLDHEIEISPAPIDYDTVELGDTEALASLAATTAALGIDSLRPALFALAAARAHAALHRRTTLAEEDLAAAARLVLAPRATRLPPTPNDVPPEKQEPDNPGEGTEERGQADQTPQDLVLEAALADIPTDLLAQLSQGSLRRAGSGGSAGKRTRSKLRGRPLGARPGVPRGGARLALVDTLRAAVPWQGLRRAEAGDHAGVIVRKDDLRVRRFESRSGAVTVFCVDASGSAAAARLAEAKGAIQLMLAQAYVERTEVALVAFRGAGAEVLLSPTRSLTRARRELAALPGGGGTPLAAGIHAAHALAEAVGSRGRTPFCVFLTDGKANVAADGSPGRAAAAADAEAAARALARAGCSAVVVDIAPHPGAEARKLAETMRARYLPLPMADARALERAVTAARPNPVAA
jgi:magnesium chelatase subunit D